jgi:hypothetical protein
LFTAEAEGRATDAALAALQERALPKLASLMDELTVRGLQVQREERGRGAGLWLSGRG